MAVSDHSPEAVEQRAADLQRSRSDVASIDQSELFRDAMSDTPAAPAEQPPAQQPEPTREQAPPAQADAPSPPQERQRDEHGRFLPSTTPPATQAPVAPAAATQQQPAQPATPEEALIPSWRLREERERREEMAQQLAYERDARIRYEQQLVAQQRQVQAAQEQVPDMVTDPAGYHHWVMGKIAQQNQEQQANLSFRLQHWKHGDDFMTAYNEMLGRAQRGDNSVAREVMASPDPGARMMDWYRRETSAAKMAGMDPETWAEKVWLPQYQAKQAQRAPAPQQQANGQSASATYQVPPSLSRIPGAPANGASGGDMSDPSLFAYAMRGGR
jgi:hypothetical protein